MRPDTLIEQAILLAAPTKQTKTWLPEIVLAVLRGRIQGAAR